MPLTIIRYLFTASFLITAIYHAIGIISPSMVEPSSLERHLVFILINLSGAILLLWNRPRPLLIFTPLIIQQIWSHGVYGIKVLNEQNRIDWASVFVLIGMPLLGYYIFRKNKEAPLTK